MDQPEPDYATDRDVFIKDDDSGQADGDAVSDSDLPTKIDEDSADVESDIISALDEDSMGDSEFVDSELEDGDVGVKDSETSQLDEDSPEVDEIPDAIESDADEQLPSNIIFRETFETEYNSADWELGKNTTGVTKWERGVPNSSIPPYSAERNNVMAVNLQSTYGPYSNIDALYKGEIEIGLAGNPKMKFLAYIDTEISTAVIGTLWDYLVVKVEKKSGTSWSSAKFMTTTTDSSMPMRNDTFFQGTRIGGYVDDGYYEFFVDLSEFKGETIRFAFYFHSDSGDLDKDHYGVYIDDVIIFVE